MGTARERRGRGVGGVRVYGWVCICVWTLGKEFYVKECVLYRMCSHVLHMGVGGTLGKEFYVKECVLYRVCSL